MTIKELKEILNTIDHGIIKDRTNCDTLKKVSIEYGTDGGITIYFDFEPEENKKQKEMLNNVKNK